jgi:flagellin
MRIQHNIMAMNAYRNYTNNTTALSKNLEKLSSGYKINRAGDDAAGLAISEKMRAQITGLKTAQKNVKDGISLVKTAEGATQEVHDMLNRMVDLATQSANGTYQDEVDREAITNEFEQLKSEINRIADSSNFNGIKLLNGELESGPKDIKVGGVDSTKALAVAGSVTNTTAFKAAANVKAGDTFEMTVSLDDGTSVTGKVIVEAIEGDNTNVRLVDADGNVLNKSVAAAAGVTDVVMTNAMAKALKNTSLGESFTITAVAADKKIQFDNVEAGKSNVPQIDAFEQVVKGTKTADSITVKTAAADAGVTINGADITLYNGKNYEDAVFTINGHKFVLMTGDNDADDLGKDGTAMNATLGLGSDVHVLISNGDNNGLVTDGTDDVNFAQNIALIKEVTGLNVEDNAGAGIKLTLNPDAKSGLTLQIGDTSDDYNQLTVSIKDMHVDALGIDKISLGTQAGAQAAVTAIKDAINYVSQVRGTLGATQNRLEHTQNNLSVMAENIQDAESTIRDTDVAEEMMAYTKNNILVQSAQAMLAQANQVPQGVLQLLG